MRILSTLLVAALLATTPMLAPSLADASGGQADDPVTEQLKQRIADYQLCFYMALPEAMSTLGDNTPNEALADRALDACGGELQSIKEFLATAWKDQESASIAVKEIRDTTRELALEEFAKARAYYPDALAKMKEHKESQNGQ